MRDKSTKIAPVIQLNFPIKPILTPFFRIYNMQIYREIHAFLPLLIEFKTAFGASVLLLADANYLQSQSNR